MRASLQFEIKTILMATSNALCFVVRPGGDLSMACVFLSEDPPIGFLFSCLILIGVKGEKVLSRISSICGFRTHDPEVLGAKQPSKAPKG